MNAVHTENEKVSVPHSAVRFLVQTRIRNIACALNVLEFLSFIAVVLVKRSASFNIIPFFLPLFARVGFEFRDISTPILKVRGVSNTIPVEAPIVHSLVGLNHLSEECKNKVCSGHQKRQHYMVHRNPYLIEQHVDGQEDHWHVMGCFDSVPSVSIVFRAYLRIEDRCNTVPIIRRMKDVIQLE